MSTSTEVDLRPSCGECGVFMELRDPPGGHTPEQRFCGVWYDHPAIGGGYLGHTYTVLYQSPELIHQLAEMS